MLSIACSAPPFLLKRLEVVLRTELTLLRRDLATFLYLVRNVVRRNNVTDRLLSAYLAVRLNVRSDLSRARDREEALRRSFDPLCANVLRLVREGRLIRRSRLLDLFYEVLLTRRPSFADLLLACRSYRV